MKIKIYQMKIGTDTDNAVFRGASELIVDGHVDETQYKCVFKGYMPASGLDDVYARLNEDLIPPTYQGRSMSVSDVLVVEPDDLPEYYGLIRIDWPGERGTETHGFTDQEKMDDMKRLLDSAGISYKADYVQDKHMKSVRPGAYFCDSIGWKELDFRENLAEDMDGIRVIRIEPGHPAYETCVKPDLRSLQNAVSDHGEPSLIEISWPLSEPKGVLVIGNEEAKLIGMEGNRYIGHELYAGPILFARETAKGDLKGLHEKDVRNLMQVFSDAPQITQEQVRRSIGFGFADLS